MTDQYRTQVALAATGKTRYEPETDGEGFFPCETGTCAFNHHGECRHFAVEEEMPVLTEEDGCLSGILED